ncbi:hypothetical protein GCM10009133_37580 [Cocleimonas flava]
MPWYSPNRINSEWIIYKKRFLEGKNLLFVWLSQFFEALERKVALDIVINNNEKEEKFSLFLYKK